MPRHFVEKICVNLLPFFKWFNVDGWYAAVFARLFVMVCTRHKMTKEFLNEVRGKLS